MVATLAGQVSQVWQVSRVLLFELSAVGVSGASLFLGATGVSGSSLFPGVPLVSRVSLFLSWPPLVSRWRYCPGCRWYLCASIGMGLQLLP